MSKRTVSSHAPDRVSHALIGIARDLELRMLTRLQEDRGHRGLRPSLGPFLSLIWLEARSLGELAQSLAVSKQACSQLAGVALKAGFIVRRSASGPARGQVVALSARGRVLVEAAIRILREAETDYEVMVGPARFRFLRDEIYSTLLDRYAQLANPVVNPELRDAVVASWKNPWLPLNASAWGRVTPTAKQMVTSWLKLELIHQFFEVLSEDGRQDKRRFEFWRGYTSATPPATSRWNWAPPRMKSVKPWPKPSPLPPTTPNPAKSSS